MRLYLLRLLTAVSQLLNAIRGGSPYETLSWVAAHNQHHPGWRAFGLAVEIFHCGHLAWARTHQVPQS